MSDPAPYPAPEPGHVADPDVPALVVSTPTEFEAQTKAALLRDEGIEATVQPVAPSWTGQVSISPGSRGASVWVRSADLDRARAVLESRIADSVDIDWDEVDVGEREDSLPLTPVGRMPLLIRVGLALLTAIMALCALWTIYVLLG